MKAAIPFEIEVLLVSCLCQSHRRLARVARDSPVQAVDDRSRAENRIHVRTVLLIPSHELGGHVQSENLKLRRAAKRVVRRGPSETGPLESLYVRVVKRKENRHTELGRLWNRQP